jgi:hypothetical protein
MARPPEKYPQAEQQIHADKGIAAYAYRQGLHLRLLNYVVTVPEIDCVGVAGTFRFSRSRLMTVCRTA